MNITVTDAPGRTAEGHPVTVSGPLSVPWTAARYPWPGGVAFGPWNGLGVPQAWGTSRPDHSPAPAPTPAPDLTIPAAPPTGTDPAGPVDPSGPVIPN